MAFSLRFSQVLFWLAFLSTFCLVNGCSPYRAYSGPELSREEVAVLRSGTIGGGVYVSSIDGNYSSDMSDSSEFHLLPGKHSISASYFTCGGTSDGVYSYNTSRSGDSITIDYYFEKGCAYKLVPKMLGDTWRLKIKKVSCK